MEEAKVNYAMIIRGSPQDIVDIREFIKEGDYFLVYDDISSDKLRIVRQPPQVGEGCENTE